MTSIRIGFVILSAIVFLFVGIQSQADGLDQNLPPQAIVSCGNSITLGSVELVSHDVYDLALVRSWGKVQYKEGLGASLRRDANRYEFFRWLAEQPVKLRLEWHTVDVAQIIDTDFLRSGTGSIVAITPDMMTFECVNEVSDKPYSAVIFFDEIRSFEVVN